jgi:hypothetical protein
MISTDGAGSGGAVLDLLVDVDLTGTTTLVNLNVSGAVDIAGDLTLSAGGDGALRFTAASSVKVLDNNAAALVFEEADNAYMTFVTTDGSEAVKFDKALDINAATQIDATVTVGVDDTGYDVKLFGATTGKSLLWDESADSLIVTGSTSLQGGLEVGVDDTGYDVKFFGATAGAYMLWDESADDLILGGAAGLSVNSTALVTGVLTTTAATVHTGGITMPDSAIAKFGTGSDLQIYHDGSDSYISDQGTGNLQVLASAIALNNAANTENMITAIADGAVTLYHDNAAKIATTATGIDVTGTVVADGLTTNTAGTSNFIAGVNAGNSIVSGGNYNVLVGDEAGTSITTGDENIAIGYNALLTEDTGKFSVAIGVGALQAQNNDGNNYNTAVGHEAGKLVTTGVNNTLIGGLAGDAITTGSQNTALGEHAAGKTTTASDNTAVGRAAMYDNTTGANNVAVGKDALYSNTTANNNTAVGYQALEDNTTGDENNALGGGALGNNTTGVDNDAQGYHALFDNTTGSNNVAMGNRALAANTTASNNTAVGRSALAANTTGTNNTAVGYLAGDAVTTANDASCFGYSAGGAITTGNYNTCIGREAGVHTTALTTGNSNTLIGSYCRTTAADSLAANVFGHDVAGAAGWTTIGYATADIRAQHGVATWATVSDERYKKDIVDSTAGLSFINALLPRTFKYKTLGELPDTFRAYKEGSTEVFKNSDTNHGFIAQEIKAAIDLHPEIKDGFKLWDERDDGGQEVAEAALIPVLVKAIQELSAKNDALEARLAALES